MVTRFRFSSFTELIVLLGNAEYNTFHTIVRELSFYHLSKLFLHCFYNSCIVLYANDAGNAVKSTQRFFKTVLLSFIGSDLCFSTLVKLNIIKKRKKIISVPTSPNCFNLS